MSILNIKDVNINEIIINNKELLSVKDLLNKLNYNFNELYVDKFWDSIENDKWIYIDHNMLIWMGYNSEEDKNNKQNYIKILKENFEIEIDYKLLNTTSFNTSLSMLKVHLKNIEINNHNKTKHLIISPDCFKQSLMILRTEKAKEIKKYYIELEKIFKFYIQYQNIYQKKILEDKQKELEQTKDKVMDMERDFKHKELEFDEFIYIATNYHYHQQNVYKIGKSNRLNKREKQFNTFFINGQKMQYIFIFQNKIIYN